MDFAYSPKVRDLEVRLKAFFDAHIYRNEKRFYDEVEKANQTLVLIKSIDLRPLDPNLFTKAWLESKSR